MDSSQIFEKLIAHYSDKFEVLYDVKLDDIDIPAMASMKNREEKTILGFSTKQPGREAAEHLFFLREDCFDEAVLSKVDMIFKTAAKQYINPDKDHAFTFLSAVVVAERVDAAAAKRLKKYKYGEDYRACGWMISRAVVFCGDGDSFSSRDGVDLQRMLSKDLV